MGEALERFVYVEKDAMVLDTKRKGEYALDTFNEFKMKYSNIPCGKSTLPVRWLAERERRTVRDVVYAPGRPKEFESGGCKHYNNFKGTELLIPSEAGKSEIEVMIKHLDYLFPKAADKKLFTQWLAFTVQRPATRVPWCPLLIGAPGVGKTVLYQILQKLLGKNNTSKISSGDVLSAYNEFIGGGKLLVCIEDLFVSTRAAVEALKPLITDTSILVNNKYGGRGQQEVFANFLALSNSEDAIAVSRNDRRFWVHRIAAEQNNEAYYTKLFAWLDDDVAVGHFLKYLLDVDVSSFLFAKAPDATRAKRDMADNAMDVYEQIIYDAIEAREGIFQASVLQAHLVLKYVQNVLGVDTMHPSEINKVYMTFRHHSYSLAKATYRIPIGRKRVDKRLRSVRDSRAWAEADSETIIHEYKRAVRLASGEEDMGTRLVVIKNEGAEL
jgi:hypothetical protein